MGGETEVRPRQKPGALGQKSGAWGEVSKDWGEGEARGPFRCKRPEAISGRRFLGKETAVGATQTPRLRWVSILGPKQQLETPASGDHKSLHGFFITFSLCWLH